MSNIIFKLTDEQASRVADLSPETEIIRLDNNRISVTFNQSMKNGTLWELHYLATGHQRDPAVHIIPKNLIEEITLQVEMCATDNPELKWYETTLDRLQQCTSWTEMKDLLLSKRCWWPCFVVRDFFPKEMELVFVLLETPKADLSAYSVDQLDEARLLIETCGWSRSLTYVTHTPA